MHSIFFEHSCRYCTCNPRRDLTAGLRRSVRRFMMISAWIGVVLAGNAMASTPSDIRQLIADGKLDLALETVSVFIKENPGDPTGRFLKGVILAKKNKVGEAIVVNTELIEGFPDLAEPHNNLAVLYASLGQLDMAREALEIAIRKNPAYTTAYDNAGSLYATLSSMAFDKAVQLDSRNAAVRSKLNALSSINGDFGKIRGTQTAVLAIDSVDSSTFERIGDDFARLAYFAFSKVRELDAAATGIEAKRAALIQFAPAAMPVLAENVTQSTTAFAASAVPAPQSVTASMRTAAQEDDSRHQLPPRQNKTSFTQHKRNDVLAIVSEWASAWSAKDVDRYLHFYSSEFESRNGVSRSSWEKARRVRIKSKSGLQVIVDSPQVTMEGDLAIVNFHQIYRSDQFNENTSKTLVLSKQNDQWKILREIAGNWQGNIKGD